VPEQVAEADLVVSHALHTNYRQKVCTELGVIVNTRQCSSQFAV